MSAEYDLVVVGSGPAGQRAAVQGAKLGRNIALVERHVALGGACVNTGTIPSKTIREAILYLTGLNQRAIYGQSYRLKESVSIDGHRAPHAPRRRARARDHPRPAAAEPRLDPRRLRALRRRRTGSRSTGATATTRHVTAKHVVIATGSTPAHPSEIAFNRTTILDSDDIVLRLAELPTTIVVVGAGVIGIEFASMFAALGSKVTVVDARSTMLDFCDPEIVEALRYHLRELNVIFRFGERVVRVEERGNGTLTSLESGKLMPADVVFYSAGRQGAVADLDLANAGLEADERGRIAVDERYRTAVPHIYAVGDVVGFPSLASASAEQGRLAACDIFGILDLGERRRCCRSGSTRSRRSATSARPRPS